MKQEKNKKRSAGWWFLLAVVIIYLAVGLINPNAIMKSFIFFFSIIKKIIWVFVFVFFIMVLTNYFVKPKKLTYYLGRNAGARGWLISVISGIISTGPIYVWYPLLNELQKKGIRNGFIAAFLYNRAIKPALLPLIIFYFGLAYTIVLTAVMILTSIFQGIVVEKLVGAIRND